MREVFFRYIWYLGFVMYSVDSATINQLHLQQQPLLSQQTSCSNPEALLLMAGRCFHVTRAFFYVFPKRKRSAQVRGVGAWCIYRNAPGGEADALVLVGKCRQESAWSWAGRGRLHVITLVFALRHRND